MKIAVLYICTGKYNQFFEGFYKSAEEFFLNGLAEKEYYVFTDNMNLSDAYNVHLYERKCQGFPMDSLFRFDMFLSIENEIKKCDYAFFFNSNMLFVAPVGVEFLPRNRDFSAVRHPGLYKTWAPLLPYERNKKSNAYIAPYEKNYRYYMGSLNGGKAEAFVEFARCCSKWTHDDFNRGIIACVHDESHLNKYMRDVDGEDLSPEYAVPEGWKTPFVPKIIILDKTKKDPYFNKGRKKTFSDKIRKMYVAIRRVIIWYF